MSKADIDIDGIRDLPGIRDILETLEAKEGMLVIKGTLMGEIRSYLSASKQIPKRICVDDRNSVNAAQEALHMLQARVDRVLTVQMSTMKVQQALGRLEVLARVELARVGAIGSKSTGTVVKQVIGLVLPELLVPQQRWLGLEKLCQQVLTYLGDAKDTVRLQIRLDENANWSRRYSGG